MSLSVGTAARAPIEVAAGVVIRADGAVLLGQRPAGKPYAGWWEFPGGKLEAGETVAQALVRELDEELGLRVRASCPWVVREFVYPHAHVRLHFLRVYDVDGDPEPREGQAFTWCDPAAIGVAPLLPATVPVIAWLRLPAMIERWTPAAAARSAATPPRLFVLDEPDISPVDYEAAFYAARAACRDAGARLITGCAHGESYARAADGVVLSGAALMACEGRPAVRIVAARCASAAELAHAQQLCVDAAIVRATAGSHALPAWACGASVPVYLAGADLDARIARRAGAHGLAPTY